MTDEREPTEGPASPAATLARFVRRVLSPRAVVWLCLTIAVALMISRQERQGLQGPATKEREPAADRAVESPGPSSSSAEPPQMWAAPKPARPLEPAVRVRCEVTREAVERKTFEKLLDANKIAWREKGSEAEHGERCLEVEASPAQLDAVLAAMRLRSEAFGRVTVERPRGEVSRRGAEGRRPVLFLLRVR